MGRVFKVAYGRMDVDGLFSTTPSAMRVALRESWQSGASVSRYGRTWHLPSYVEIDDMTWRGRIGFVNEDDLTTLEWDARRMDFVEGAASSGVVVPFVIRLDTRVVAFQLISGTVRPTTFTGALQGMLNVQHAHRWLIRPLVRHQSLESWKRSVDRISSFSFRLNIPNPNWTGREKVENIMEELNTEIIRLRGSAAGSESVGTDSDLFRQAMDHVQRGYGRAVVRGTEATTNEETEWNSDDDGSVPVVSIVEGTDDQAEVDPSQLRESTSVLDDMIRTGTGEEPEDDA